MTHCMGDLMTHWFLKEKTTKWKDKADFQSVKKTSGT